MEKSIIKTPDLCCVKCFFSMPTKGPDGTPLTRCNKRPPKVLGGMVTTPGGAMFQTFTVWPTVHPTEDWCGKFKVKGNSADAFAKLASDDDEGKKK